MCECHIYLKLVRVFVANYFLKPINDMIYRYQSVFFCLSVLVNWRLSWYHMGLD